MLRIKVALSRRIIRHGQLALAVLFAGVIALASVCAAEIDPKAWERSTNPETKERYIPVELWAGTDWDGKRELKMPKVDATYTHPPRTQYQIKGPVEWTQPGTSQTFLVYERINPGRDGVKLQRFTINQEQSGLGRVYDVRPALGMRIYSGGLKFPVGYWQEGETRKFVYKDYERTKTSDRAETITIKRIDFTFQDNSHCLEFYWTATDGSGGRVYDRQTYIYCAGKSMVSQIQH